MKNKVIKDYVCPLCELRKITELIEEDDKVVICRCASHLDKWMVILRRHTDRPTREELEYMHLVADNVLGQRRWRGPISIPQHFHLHEE